MLNGNKKNYRFICHSQTILYRVTFNTVNDRAYIDTWALLYI